MRIGTRASALAVTQARSVAKELGRDELVHVEIVEIQTSGDRGGKLSDKSRWTSELELALIEGRIDVAVHSAKDVPNELAHGTVLGAIPLREDPRDVICGAASLEDLAPGARVGTASLRRRAQLKALRGDLEVVPLRGNVDTRLRKLEERQADAIVIAYAGLRRLGRELEAGGFLEALVPAAGQGALALQVRGEDSEVGELVDRLSDTDTTMCVTAERALTAALGASCHTAVGAFATTRPPGREPLRGVDVQLSGWVGLPDGSQWITDSCIGDPASAAAELSERMIAAGASELIARGQEAGAA